MSDIEFMLEMIEAANKLNEVWISALSGTK